ncbi:MAG: aldo/keto reductase [Candidatus Sericytochromatia bacterium]|nr:aldo/keto reductase [Candidatus Sericytochromatia bacterium]
MSAASTALSVQGHSAPRWLYGTAWKEERTAELVQLALNQGFRGIDTANQRKHYFEAAVGEALQAVLAGSQLQRADLFLQSKFTFRAGQDHRLPYDPEADFTTQVMQSFARSLQHLQTDYLDSYLLHGPSTGHGLQAADKEVWRAMEALQRSGQTRLIGVSNVNLQQLEQLLAFAEVPPAFVQNRCYAITGWDQAIRSLCRQHGIVYQGFSLLTANAQWLQHSEVLALARQYGAPPTQIVFAFALAVGMQPLTGTSRAEHMALDLAASGLQLTPAEIQTLEQLAR